MPNECEFVTKTVRIPEAMMQEIDRLAREEDLTFSQWARRAIRKELQREDEQRGKTEAPDAD